jgi:hypothetical protein
MPDAYGPQTSAIQAPSELAALAAAWHASDDILAAWAAARAAEAAAWAITWSAALALSTRDQLPPEHYRALTGLTIRARVIGRVHPDDPDRRGGDHDA